MPMFVMSLASTEGTKQSLSFQSHDQKGRRFRTERMDSVAERV
jgi:hypothetical protein